MNEELFAVSYIQELAEYLAKKMVEMNLQVDAVLFIERACGPYSFEIKCSNRFTREQLKARIKELMTDGETDVIGGVGNAIFMQPTLGKFTLHAVWLGIYNYLIHL